MTRIVMAVLAVAVAGIARAQQPVIPDAPPVDEASPAGEAAPDGAAARTVRLVYTGGSGGVGAARYVFAVHRRLAEAASAGGRVLTAERPLHGVFHQGPHAVWATDGTTASIVAFLRAGEPACEVDRPGVGLRTPTEWALLPADAGLGEVAEVERAPVTWRRCEGGGVEAWWVGPAEADPPRWDLESFDVRLGVRYALDDAPLYVLGMPRQEAARRVQAIRERLAALPGGAWVDAGGFVPGASSVEYGAMSLHRPTGFDALERLGPSVLVPGASELAPGPARFLDEAAAHHLDYVATNWRADDPALELPRSVRRVLGGVDVAFVGAVDPAIEQIGDRLAGTDVRLVDPVIAVQQEVDALNTGEDPPELVVLLSWAGPELQARLRRRLHGVDVHLGDRYGATLRVDAVTTGVRAVSRFDKAAPITLPMDGVAVAAMQVGPQGLERIEVEPVPVTADEPADPTMRAGITGVRAEVYPGRDDVLIPASADDPLGTVDEETLQRVVCEAVLEATRADAVFLPELQDATRVPGPFTELQVSDRLALLDVLEVHAVDGDRMDDFLFQVYGEVETTCGADIGSRFPKVRGRYVDANRTYRVVTTDRARQTTDLGAILAAASSDLVLHHPKHRPLVDAQGRPLLLSEVALARLRAWRAEADDGWVDRVAARSSGDKPPLWLLDVDRLALRVESFQRPDRPAAYDQVPETKINSPDSLTLGGELDAGLDFSGPDVDWDLRTRAGYTRLAIEDQEPQETADDWQVSTSLSLRRLAFPAGGAPRWMPFAEVRYDSEFTRLEGAATAQSDLSLTLGLSALRWRWLRALRAGGFVNQDLAHLPGNAAGVAVKSPEYGGSLEAETRHDFFEASSVRLETRWEAQVFGDTPRDDAADLRLRLFGEARLQLRLIRWLDAALFAQGLLVQGRVPETRQPAGSMTLGAALDLASAFRLTPVGR